MNKPIRILHLVPRFSHGGVSKIVSEIIDGTRILNVESFVGSQTVTWNEKLNYSKISWLYIPLFPSSLKNIVIAFFFLLKIIKKYNINVIHSHNRYTSIIGHAVAIFYGLPFLCTVHDLTIGNKIISRWAYGNTITVFSSAVESHLFEHFGVPHSKIYQIPIGFSSPINQSHEDIRILKMKYESLGSSIIGFVGRLDIEKGIETLLYSIPSILLAHPTAKLWVVGDGPLLEDLLSLTKILEIQDNVVFCGWQNNVYPFIECFDFLVAPSLKEGFGISVIEAMLLGKSVIASRVGNFPNLIEHGKSGLLVEPNNKGELIKVILHLLNDPQFASKMGDKARIKVLGKYNKDMMVNAFLDIYKKLKND